MTLVFQAVLTVFLRSVTFEKYCSNHGLHVRDRIVISDDGRMVTTLPNLLGAVAIYRFNKGQAS